VKTFVVVSLYLLVVAALGGIFKPFATDARYRSPGRVITALIAAAWVAVTLISAAVLL
jgi:hypothetical protein